MGWKDKVKAVADKGQEALDQARVAQEGRKDEQEARRAQQRAEWERQGILFQGKSHEEGRNATVTLYADRIERVKERSMASLSRAKQDTEVTPLRSVSSVQAKKDGILWTKVTVYASGNNIDFRFHHEEAQEFKNEIQRLLLDPAKSGPPSTPPPAVDPLDQLKKLGELKNAGIISDEEFEAKKKQLLDL